VVGSLGLRAGALVAGVVFVFVGPAFCRCFRLPERDFVLPVPLRVPALVLFLVLFFALLFARLFALLFGLPVVPEFFFAVPVAPVAVGVVELVFAFWGSFPPPQAASAGAAKRSTRAKSRRMKPQDSLRGKEPFRFGRLRGRAAAATFGLP
jgi:hypothetical protein